VPGNCQFIRRSRTGTYFANEPGGPAKYDRQKKAAINNRGFFEAD